jgi:hypothetical protein
MEPLDGLEPPSFPYEGNALPGELQRHGCPPWPRTRNLRNQGPALCHFELMGIGCAARDLNPTETQVKSLPLYH